MKFCSVAVAGVLLAAGCAPDTLVRVIPLERIEQGCYCYIGDPRDLVVKTRTEWDELWREMKGEWSSPPEIDFTEYNVLACFLGARPTTGYSIEIKWARGFGDQVLVWVETCSPGPHEIVSPAFTFPYDVVKIPAVTKPVVFERSSSP